MPDLQERNQVSASHTFCYFFLQVLYIIKMKNQKANREIFQIYKPIEWCKQLVLLSPTRSVLLYEIFLHDHMVNADGIYGHKNEVGPYLFRQHDLFITSTCWQSQSKSFASLTWLSHGETNIFVNFENLPITFDSNLASYLTPYAYGCVNVQNILKTIYTYTTCTCIVTGKNTINSSNQDR